MGHRFVKHDRCHHANELQKLTLEEMNSDKIPPVNQDEPERAGVDVEEEPVELEDVEDETIVSASNCFLGI